MTHPALLRSVHCPNPPLQEFIASSLNNMTSTLAHMVQSLIMPIKGFVHNGRKLEDQQVGKGSVIEGRAFYGRKDGWGHISLEYMQLGGTGKESSGVVACEGAGDGSF